MKRDNLIRTKMFLLVGMAILVLPGMGLCDDQTPTSKGINRYVVASNSSDLKGSGLCIGVGYIQNKLDHTSDSFSLAWYLHQHPFEIDGKPVKVRLVDHSSEADYSVSGQIEGHVSYTYGLLPDPHKYTWRQEASLKVRRRGEETEEVHFESTGTQKSPKVIPNIRMLALEDIWMQLAEHLEQRVAEDMQKISYAK